MSPTSKTALQTFARCPRLYKYNYLDKRVPKDRAWNLRFGITFHKGIEVFWQTQGQPFKDRVSAMIEHAREVDSEVCNELMQVLLACYCDRWGEQEYEVLHLEKEFVADGFIAIPDAVLKDEAGNIIMLESKTTKSDLRPESWYWQLDFNLQLGLYKHILEQNGVMVDRVVYDVTRVPPWKQGKDGRSIIQGETSKEFVDRITEKLQKNYDYWFVRRTIPLETVDGVSIDAFELKSMISLSKDAKRFPRNSNACKMYGKKCEYYGVCNGSESLKDEELFENKRRR